MADGYNYYLLQLVAAQSALASVYVDPKDPDGFYTGYVECAGTRHFLMADVTPWGRLEGWRVLRTGAVLQLLLGEEYERRLELLMAHYGDVHRPFFAQALREEDNVLLRVLEQCRQEKTVISIAVGPDMITGRVSEVNELRVRIDALSFLGECAGDELITLREIEMVSIGTQEEQMYRTLERMASGAQLRILGKDGPDGGLTRE